MADNALTKLSLNGQIGASIAAAALVGGLFYYFYYADAVQEREDKTVRARGAAEGDPRPRGDREQAAGVPARGRSSSRPSSRP